MKSMLVQHAYEGHQIDRNEGKTLHRHQYHVQQIYRVSTGLQGDE
jgi:hypothetical protein